MSLRRKRLFAAGLAAVACACARPAPAGPVRTADEASALARRELKAAGLDEEVVGAQRQGPDWVVTTRWRETSAAGHLVTVEAATGRTKLERYRSIELVGRP